MGCRHEHESDSDAVLGRVPDDQLPGAVAAVAEPAGARVRCEHGRDMLLDAGRTAGDDGSVDAGGHIPHGVGDDGQRDPERCGGSHHRRRCDGHRHGIVV